MRLSMVNDGDCSRFSLQSTVVAQDYMAKLRDTSTNGAIFFVVWRGKVSEGLDFTVQVSRAVMLLALHLLCGMILSKPGGGPSYTVELGRRDGRISIKNNVQ